MISAIMPTTGRADQARRCIQQFFDTTRGHSFELIAMIDNGDRKTLTALLDIKHEALIVRMFDGQHGPVVLWNEGARVAQGDMLFLAADDLWPMEGWLDAILACHDKLGTGVIGINDMSRADDLAAHYLIDRQAAWDILGGVFVVPHYYSQYLDIELTEKAQSAGRYCWCKDAKVEHRHRAFGKAAHDATYAVGDQHMQLDRRTWQIRRAYMYPIDYEGYL